LFDALSELAHATRRSVPSMRVSGQEKSPAMLWSKRMEGFRRPALPSPTVAQCLNGGYAWPEVMCHRCQTRVSLPLDAIRRPRDTPIWKLEAALNCRSCRTWRYSPPVHMIKLTKERERLMRGCTPTMMIGSRLAVPAGPSLFSEKIPQSLSGEITRDCIVF
jgi:hypothetical protein